MSSLFRQSEKIRKVFSGQVKICFVRQKTERTSKTVKEIRASVTPEMQAIIQRWGNPYGTDNYIFPFLADNETALQRKVI
jgi:hypothetical protein